MRIYENSPMKDFRCTMEGFRKIHKAKLPANIDPSCTQNCVHTRCINQLKLATPKFQQTINNLLSCKGEDKKCELCIKGSGIQQEIPCICAIEAKVECKHHKLGYNERSRIKHNLSMCNTVKGQLEKDTKFQKILFQKPMCKMTSYSEFISANSKINKVLNCSNSSTESTKIYSHECQVGNKKNNLTEGRHIPHDLFNDSRNASNFIRHQDSTNYKVLISSGIYTNRSMIKGYDKKIQKIFERNKMLNIAKGIYQHSQTST